MGGPFSILGGADSPLFAAVENVLHSYLFQRHQRERRTLHATPTGPPLPLPPSPELATHAAEEGPISEQSLYPIL